MTPEGLIKKQVDRVLTTAGAYYHKPVVNGMGKPTLDYVGCHLGLFFAIETKAEGKQMTERQKITATAMTDAGGRVFLVNAVTGTEELETWLQDIDALEAEMNSMNALLKSMEKTK